MGRPKGATNVKVIEDLPAILDLIGQGKSDREIREELKLSFGEYKVRLRYIRENRIIELAIADSALRAPLRMIYARKTAVQAFEKFRPIPESANAAMGALKLCVEIDRQLVELAQKLGILYLQPLENDEKPFSPESIGEKSDSELIIEHNARIAALG